MLLVSSIFIYRAYAQRMDQASEDAMIVEEKQEPRDGDEPKSLIKVEIGDEVARSVHDLAKCNTWRIPGNSGKVQKEC